jgi:hypothetical protein
MQHSVPHKVATVLARNHKRMFTTVLFIYYIRLCASGTALLQSDIATPVVPPAARWLAGRPTWHSALGRPTALAARYPPGDRLSRRTLVGTLRKSNLEPDGTRIYCTENIANTELLWCTVLRLVEDGVGAVFGHVASSNTSTVWKQSQGAWHMVVVGTLNRLDLAKFSLLRSTDWCSTVIVPQFGLCTQSGRPPLLEFWGLFHKGYMLNYQ